MIKNEYKNVKEISILTVQSERNVRRIIKKLEGKVAKELLYQDENNKWVIHERLLKEFKLQRVHKDKYYALTIDPCRDYPENEIDEIMGWVMLQMGEVPIELNYVVQKKVANGQNHIHCFVKCGNKNKLLQCIRLGFSNVSYRKSSIFDLERWKGYMEKDYDNIKTLKK